MCFASTHKPEMPVLVQRCHFSNPQVQNLRLAGVCGDSYHRRRFGKRPTGSIEGSVKILLSECRLPVNCLRRSPECPLQQRKPRCLKQNLPYMYTPKLKQKQQRYHHAACIDNQSQNACTTSKPHLSIESTSVSHLHNENNCDPANK